jgi:hypothetical protein
LNAYIPLLTLALLAKFTNLIKLSEPWNALTSWWIIGLLLVLSVIEFFADKVPAVNHINDLIQTVIRPVAGAIAFAASARVVTDLHPVLALAAGLLISGSVHIVKAGILRPMVTATTGGVGNVPVSIAEDAVATSLSLVAIIIPILIGTLLIVIAALVFWRFWMKSEKPQAI